MVIGNVDDTDVRRVLTYVVANGERFDPGCGWIAWMRRKRAATTRKCGGRWWRRHERTKCRGATESFGRTSQLNWGDSVRGGFAGSVAARCESSVRVEAVNLLVRSLQGDSQDRPEVHGDTTHQGTGCTFRRCFGGPRWFRALEDLQTAGSEPVWRLRSAAALRQIGARDVQ